MKKLLKNLFKNSLQKGFTLIELLVVIAVLGVLATIVLLAVNPGEQLARARDTSRIAGATQLGRALQAYYTAAGGSLTGVKDADVAPVSLVATDWMGPLITSQDLKVRPGNPSWGSLPTVAKNCTVKYSEATDPAGVTGAPNGTGANAAGGYCYRVDLSTSAHNAVVYVALESKLYINKCPALSPNAYGVFSTADARFGVVCRADSADPVTGTQSFIATP